MYIKKKLGSDAAIFKYINRTDEECLPLHVEGTIRDVGVDYVELLQDDNRVISVLTDRIQKVRWLDLACDQVCRKCHHHDCRCITLERHSHYDDCCDVDRQPLSFKSKMVREKDVCPHCNKHPHDCCEPRFVCVCDHAIPFCDDKLELRLAGLTDELNFKLFHHKGCKVKLELA